MNKAQHRHEPLTYCDGAIFAPWDAKIDGNPIVAQVMGSGMNGPQTKIGYETAQRLVAAYNACKGISTDRLEKMVPGTLANLLTITGARDQLTESRIAEIIDNRMVKACYEPMGKEIAVLIVEANMLTLKDSNK